MSFGNVPPDLLVGAIEKLLAKMDETDLVVSFEREWSTMPENAGGEFIEGLFEAFRERGESSEDAAEGAGVSLDAIERRDPAAVRALFAYARTSPDLIKEATTIFVERRPDLIEALPSPLRGALAEQLGRLSRTTP
jgi:hypothetical protein